MTIDSCYELGIITKPHGLKGEVQIHLDVDYPDEYTELESVFVEINKQLVPFFIESIQLMRDQKAVVRLEDVNSIEEAEQLRGLRMFLPLEFLPELEEGQFYFHEVIGYSVVDEKLGQLGVASSFHDSTAQTLLLMEYQQKEVLIPVTDGIFLGADHQKKQILVNLPEGLVDIYLHED